MHIENDGLISVVLERGQVVRGVVLDPAGTALPASRVVLDGAQQTFTDDEGRFECGGIESAA